MIFKTLTSEIEQQLKDSIYKNETFKEYEYGFITRRIVKWSKKPIIQSLKFGIFFLFLSILILQLQYLRYTIPPFIFDWNFLLEAKDLIFNAQVTILALIFPLVIGFVGILIKDDIANKSLWKIYSRYSGFMLVGFSGIFLIVCISVTILIKPFLESIQYFNYSISSIFFLWFIFNNFLLTWLIYSTFEFIKIEKRNKIILEFTLNIIICNEVKKYLYYLMPLNSYSYKLLPIDFKEGTYKVDFFNFGDDKKIVLDKVFKNRKYLKDINYSFLAVGLSLWKLRNKYFLIKKNIELILPITGSGESLKKYKLVLTKNSNLNALESYCIKNAYKFSSTNEYLETNVESVVDSLFNNLDNALKDNDERNFEKSLEEVRQFLITIFSVTTFIDDNGKIDNWLLLSKNAWFSQKLLHDITKEFYSLNKNIINKVIEHNSAFYMREMSYFYQYSFDRKLPNLIIKSLLDAHSHLWSQLVKNKQIENSNLSDILFKEFIAGWESWSNVKERDLSTKENCKLSCMNLHNHLVNSSTQIISALKYKNEEASIWAVNILNNWYENYFALNHVNNYLWKKDILNSFIFSNKRYEEIINFIGNTNDNMLFEEIYLIALKNEWKQTRIITAAYILNSNILSENDKKLIFSLLNGDLITPNSDVQMNFRTIIANKILETYLLNESSFWKLTKNGLSKLLVDEFEQQTEETRISGRIYSSWGKGGNETIQSSIKALLIANSNRTFDLDRNIYDLFFSSLFTMQNKVDLIRILEEFKVITNNVKEKVKILLNIDEISVFINNYEESINKIITTINTTNENDISNKDISLNRLNLIKKYLSKGLYNEDKIRFPLSLFTKISFASTLDERFKFTVNLNGINKRNLIEGDIQNAFNEDTFFEEVMEDKVDIKVFSNIFNNILYKDFVFTNIKDLLIGILEKVNNSENEIVLVCESKIVRFLLELKWNKKEVPFQVVFRDIVDTSYICDLNGISVHSIRGFSNTNYCLLCNKNIFEEIKFKKFNDEFFVDLEFKEEKQNEGKFVITTFIETIFDTNSKNYKFILNKEEKE